MSARYDTLDGLRGIAAVAVMLLHSAELTMKLSAPGVDAAVDFFFLLSGFVLSAAYAAPGPSYVVARVIRLYPMTLFGVALGAVLLLSTGISGAWGVVLTFNLLGLPHPTVGYAFDHSLWSIAVEGELSIAFLLLARLPRVALVAAVVALVFVAPAQDYRMGLFAFVRGALPFTTGVLLHRLFPARRGNEFMAIGSAGALIVLLLVPYLARVPAAQTALFSLVLIAGRAEPPKFLMAPAVYLGRLSYPLYAVHWPIGWWMSRHAPAGIPSVLITIAASVVVAHLAMIFFDEPVRKWLMRRIMPMFGSRPRGVIA